MTDNDIDQLLARHGEAWRAENADRHGVDWRAVPVTRRFPDRRWLAAGSVVALAAAIAVVVAIVVPGSNREVIGHRGTAPAAAMHGAPASFTAILGHRVEVAEGSSATGSRPFADKPVSLAVGSDGRSGYFAVPRSGCRTDIHSLKPTRFGNILRYHEVYSIPGVVAPTPMALSPDGTELAYALVKRPSSGAGCSDANALVVLNLVTHTRQTFTGSSAAVTDLVWAGDSRHLLFSGGPSAIGTGDYSTRELDTQTATRTLVGDDALPVLDPSDAGSGGLVFPWHGQLVTIVGGAMYALDGHGGLGSIVATQFPRERVESVSSDPTGDHLLISTYAGLVKYYESGSTTPILRPDYNVYRWDNGYLTEIDTYIQSYRQPGW
jgi:hypothetical protein